MILSLEIKDDKLSRFIKGVKSASLKESLNHEAAYDLRENVNDWIQANAGRHHKTAHRLGATPTGHLQEDATVSAEATAETAKVIIASPGFSRVFRDLIITPVRAKALTIPIAAVAYGRTVTDLVANGWSIFRPKGKRILMGAGPDGSEAEPLYTLSASAKIPQDRSLLPPDQTMRDVCAKAMRKVIHNLLRGRR